jgi:hypothetical protein
MGSDNEYKGLQLIIIYHMIISQMWWDFELIKEYIIHLKSQDFSIILHLVMYLSHS